MRHPCHERARASRSDASRVVLLAALAVVVSMAGCASTPRTLISPIVQQPTGLVLPGKFVWADLLTQDPEGAQSFYTALFGWTFAGSGDYFQVLHEGTPIAGMLRLDPDENRVRESAWVVNLSVPDVDAAAKQTTARGGTVVTGPTDAPERGRLALVRDPTGANFLLLRSALGDPPDGEPRHGQWLWRELWTADVDAAMAFYAGLVDYESEIMEFQHQPYHVLVQAGTPRAAVVAAPEGVSPQWLPYVRVEDAVGTAERAEALGARVVVRDEDAVILVDPTGAPIGIQMWKGPAAEGDE